MSHISSDPLDITKERNMIIVITIQSFLGIPAIVYPILSMHFFFFAMIKYVSALIEDAKISNRKIGHQNPKNLREIFIKMIKFHGVILE